MVGALYDIGFGALHLRAHRLVGLPERRHPDLGDQREGQLRLRCDGPGAAGFGDGRERARSRTSPASCRPTSTPSSRPTARRTGRPSRTATVVSRSVMTYQALWTDPQGSVEIYGQIYAAVRKTAWCWSSSSSTCRRTTGTRPASRARRSSASRCCASPGWLTDYEAALDDEAVASAATPSPRPVRPSPSVVVAETDTGAPSAAPSAASASARRGPSRGRLPITCTAALPIAEAGRADPRAVSSSSADARRRRPTAGRRSRTGSRGRPARPRTAPRRRRVGGDVGVGVARQPLRLVGPGQPGEHQGYAVGVAVHVDAEPDAGKWGLAHPPNHAVSREMGRVRDNRGVRTFRGAWSLAGLAAGLAGLATSYFVAMAMTIRESPVVAVAELVIRLTPGWLAEYLIGLVGHLDKPLLLLGIFVVLGLLFAWAGRLARPDLVGAGDRLRRPGRGRRASPSRVQRGADRDRRRTGRRRLRDLAGRLSLLTEPLRRAELAAEPSAVPAPGRAETSTSAAGDAGRPQPARVPGPGRAWSAAARCARRRRPGRGPRPAPGRGDAAGCCGCRGDRARGCRRRPASARGRLAVDDPQRRLLPDPHRDRGARDRAEGLVAAHPRHGRPGDHADLRRPGRRASSPRRWITLNCVSNPVGGDADRQRLVERRPARRPARRGRRRRPARTPCCRPPTTAGPAVRRWRRSPTTATRCSRSR